MLGGRAYVPPPVRASTSGPPSYFETMTYTLFEVGGIPVRIHGVLLKAAVRRSADACAQPSSPSCSSSTRSSVRSRLRLASPCLIRSFVANLSRPCILRLQVCLSAVHREWPHPVLCAPARATRGARVTAWVLTTPASLGAHPRAVPLCHGALLRRRDHAPVALARPPSRAARAVQQLRRGAAGSSVV